MLIKQSIIRSTFCSLLFIAVTSSAPIDIQELIFDPISYQTTYPGDDYVDPVNVNSYDYRKAKRHTSNELGQGDVLLPETRLPLTSQKVKEFLQILKKPKKSGIFTLNGWSASGMPFNVLYSPNILQQKFLAAVNVMASKKPSDPFQVAQPLLERTAEMKEDKKGYLRGSGRKMSNRSSQMRRHYLVIPHLFVSYGWGSVGK